MWQNKYYTKAHHTSTYFHTRRASCVDLTQCCFRNPTLAGASFGSHYSDSAFSPHAKELFYSPKAVENSERPHKATGGARLLLLLSLYQHYRGVSGLLVLVVGGVCCAGVSCT